MKNKVFLSALSVLILTACANSSYADPAAANIAPSQIIQVQSHHFHQHILTPEEIQNKKAAKEAKKAEFEKRLNLTDDQKKQIEANKTKDREAIMPIMKELHSKQIEYKNVEENKALSQAEKDKQKADIKAQIKNLKVQADNCRKQNLKNFESVLTPAQKSEFEKIKKEQKSKMEKAKKQHIKDMEKRHKEMMKKVKNGECPKGIFPPPHFEK